jgi:hypothetical protein
MKTPKSHKKTHENHNVKASIQTLKDPYKSSLPPQHLSLSQDLTMKLSSKSYGKPKENRKGK